MSVIELSNDEIMKCRRFAVDVVDTNIEKYKRRNQFDKKKIIKDIYIGKKAEIAAQKFLNEEGYVKDNKTIICNCLEPDFEIYGAKRKSFDADLKCEKTGDLFHVKSMSSDSAQRWGLSWSFQKEDPLVFRPEEKEHIVLCEVLDKFRVDVKMVIDAVVAKYLYGVPRLYKLRRVKKVLYWEDLMDYIEDN